MAGIGAASLVVTAQAVSMAITFDNSTGKRSTAESSITVIVVIVVFFSPPVNFTPSSNKNLLLGTFRSFS